jgi:hypothetical protein
LKAVYANRVRTASWAATADSSYKYESKQRTIT